MRWLQSSGAAFSAVVCVLLGAAPRAVAYSLDQGHSPEIATVWNVVAMAPVGQEFTPSVPLMDVAELWIVRFSTDAEVPADVFVRVRAGTVDGAVLGRSRTVHLDGPHSGAVEFHFDPPLALAPGSLCVLELGVEPDSGITFVGGNNLPDYPAGRGILYGSPRAMDLWFRTGATEGLPAADRTWGGVKADYR